MIQTCKQCGAINQASAGRCCFCEAHLNLAEEHAAIGVSAAAVSASSSTSASTSPSSSPPASDWREEVASRLRSYRARRKRLNLQDPDSQGDLPFDAGESDAEGEFLTAPLIDEMDDPLQATLASAAARMQQSREAEILANAPGETVAAKPEVLEHMEIDVSRPPVLSRPPESNPPSIGKKAFRTPDVPRPASGLRPVADLALRRRAGEIDAVCLVLSYSGVLGLFTAFGGHLQAAKLDALVCLGTLALLYLQYFTLFTVMGGATPGMMLTGLRIVSFEGDAPSPSQLLWRSFGYMVSGVTAMLGFFWALWDEDQLTWQDRISQSYITRSESLVEAAVDAQGRSGPSTFGL